MLVSRCLFPMALLVRVALEMASDERSCGSGSGSGCGSAGKAACVPFVRGRARRGGAAVPIESRSR